MPDDAAAEPVPAAPAVAAERRGVPATPADLAAAGYRAAADAPETLRAYRADLSCFRAWCVQEGRPAAIPAPPETVGAYLAALAPRYRLATLRRRLAALARAHRTAGHRLDTGHPAIRLRYRINTHLDEQGIATPAGLARTTGLSAAKAARLLRRKQWREGDLAALRAVADHLGLAVPLEGLGPATEKDKAT